MLVPHSGHSKTSLLYTPMKEVLYLLSISIFILLFNSFSFFYSVRSVPLPYTSCTMTLSDGIPYRSGGLSYRKTGITEALYHSGYTAYAPLRQPPPGYEVFSSQLHMVRIRMRRTSGNKQGNACRTWRRRCNLNGELSGGYSYASVLYVK